MTEPPEFVPRELVIDKSYRNTANWRMDEDEFNKFFRFSGQGIANAQGFRPKSINGGSTAIEDCAFCLLVTDYGQIEWPDSLDCETGLFTYFGDNREPGKKLHEVPVGGNRLLEKVFDLLHEDARGAICPFLCFESHKGADGYSYMRFLGLAVPGADGLSNLDDLVAVWRRKGQQRFQNYKAVFTILDAESVPRSWLEEMVTGVPPIEATGCPPAFKKWIKTGKRDALATPPEVHARTVADQLPQNDREERVLAAVRSLSDRQFEFFTKELLKLMDKRFFDLKVTRQVVDHGRDVVGQYRVGHDGHSLFLDICAEAKHWNERAVGVYEVMRLISRIKHRDFGIIVTTSHFHTNVQDELIEDGHPILMISGGDIARILMAKELEGEALRRWLDAIPEEDV